MKYKIYYVQNIIMTEISVPNSIKFYFFVINDRKVLLFPYVLHNLLFKMVFTNFLYQELPIDNGKFNFFSSIQFKNYFLNFRG